MILLSNIVRRILNEVLTFNQLMKFSEPKRKSRSLKMRTRSLPVSSTSTGESWNFSYKSDPSHITLRPPENPNGISHRGKITFLKEIKGKSVNAMNLPCEVDCTCEDYRFNYAYANNDKDAGPMGVNSLNKCNGKVPVKTNPHLRPGLCKHLLSLRNYLRTKLKESIKPTLEEKLDDIVARYPESTMEVEIDD